jgi:hypothetical protein
MQIILYILLLIIGLYYTGSIYLKIKDLFNIYILKEIRNINAICSEKRNGLRMKLLEADKNEDYEEIKQLSVALEILNSDREDLTRIAKRSYNLSIVFTIAGSFIGSLVLPILTMIKLVQEILKSG